ncbi:hypothetical protein PQX77_001307 [Marasmius sp. AFHP31]|nr:hypothetical protein PQX77_006054 [Marasmius sp. AFHP31]KAK1235470.1 hypothetical protein PQX77_001307 [Marasmius sp. AFHP31]
MKTAFATSLVALLVGSASGHTIFQQLYINGADQGHNNGIRVVNTNNPVMEVTSNDIICNVNQLVQPVSKTIVNIPAGGQVTTEWHHGGNGPSPGDGDDPIASSHKGPIITYLAKVSNASTASTTGLQWFKIQEDGFNPSTNTWAVDKLIANGGKYTFTMPKCVPTGQYLMRHEIIALHGAGSYPGAQFYIGCAQVSVTGGGSANPSTVSFPGAYKGSDPGITIGIYYPPVTNYVIPGPKVLTC